MIVAIPEFVVRKWRHLFLHNQNALFIKRLLLFEPRGRAVERALRARATIGATVDRETAIALCREKTLKETTVRHLISVEGVMRALAARFGEDEDLWGPHGTLPRPRPGPHR